MTRQLTQSTFFTLWLSRIASAGAGLILLSGCLFGGDETNNDDPLPSRNSTTPNSTDNSVTPPGGCQQLFHGRCEKRGHA